MLSTSQRTFLDITSKNKKVYKMLSSKTEFSFIDFLISLGYKKDIDFIHQFVCSNEDIGKIFVVDFCFPSEKFILELDGYNHKQRKHKQVDNLRDKILNENGYQVLRIKTPIDEFHKSYYKNLIPEIINNKRYGQSKMD